MPEVMARKRQSGIRMRTCPSPKSMLRPLLCTDAHMLPPGLASWDPSTTIFLIHQRGKLSL